MIRRLLICAILLSLLLPFGTTATAQSSTRYFAETQHNVGGGFLEYWTSHGGIAQQGYPITEEFSEQSPVDGKTYTVQYFERAVFEYHPENPPPNTILLSLVGKFLYQQKYPAGAPDQVPNQTGRFFAETGHWVGGRFWQYWQENGGLAQQGFPISDEFQEVSSLDGRTYTVQYFERSVFEYHPENNPPHDVLLSQLGKFQLASRYPNNSNPAAMAAAPKSTGEGVVRPPAEAPVTQPAASVPSDAQGFGEYLARKYNQIGGGSLVFDSVFGSDEGSHSVNLYVTDESWLYVLNDASREAAQEWGQNVMAEARAVWPNEPFRVTLDYSYYSDDFCSRNCIDECYYQSDDYSYGRGWFTVFTYVSVRSSGVTVCPWLE